MNRLQNPPPFPEKGLANAVDWAIVSRRSIRAFLPTPVPEHEVAEILAVASAAASGMNTQPWRVHVVTGPAKQRLTDAIVEVDNDRVRREEHTEPYDYYPTQWISPFIERRRKVGWSLYGLLGIEKGDKDNMHRQHGRNYQFFDAPVGMFFTLDPVMCTGSFLDYGMFLQSLMIAARARGLDTCAQVAFTKYHRIVAQQLRIPSAEILVSGLSLGYADASRIENTLVTEREPIAQATTYHHE